MLPFVLRRLGFDPATRPFIDATRVVVDFTVALVLLKETLPSR